MKTKAISILSLALVVSICTFVQTTAALAQTTIAPPSLGDETKGKPAIEESQVPAAQQSNDVEQEEADEVVSNGPLGSAKIVESKRESGQRYLIELEHSSGAKQYIEETDSDGKIESTSNDIEETPNLPKWKLGSW